MAVRRRAHPHLDPKTQTNDYSLNRRNSSLRTMQRRSTAKLFRIGSKEVTVKRIVVTGANKGIGLAIVEAIVSAHPDSLVFMGCRNLERGQAARDQLLEKDASWVQRLQVLPLDVTDGQSVNDAAARVRRQFTDEATPLYGLVNNAGVGARSASLKAVLDVNTFGVRRVSEAFLPLLDPEHGRIVNITSAAGPNFVASCSPERRAFLTDRELDWPRLQAFLEECRTLERDSDAFQARGLGDGNAYGLSKACANCYTMMLAREHPQLRVNACTPGFIETDMTRGAAATRGKSPSELGMQPPAAGTRAPLFLLFGELEGNGRYYGSDALRSPLDRYRAPGTEAYRGSD